MYSLYMLYKTQEGRKNPLRVKDEVHFIVYTATLLPKFWTCIQMHPVSMISYGKLG